MAKTYLGKKLQDLGHIETLVPSDKMVVVKDKDEGLLELSEFFFYVRENLDFSNYVTHPQAQATYAKKDDVFDKDAADKRFAFIDRVYTKVQSDEKYSLKEESYTRAYIDNSFARADDVWTRDNTYSKDQALEAFALKTEIPEPPDLSPYSTTHEGDKRWAGINAVYTREESDGKYARKDNTYTKGEADTTFSFRATTYSKEESDFRFINVDEGYSRDYINTNFYRKSDVYTKSEGDDRYPLRDEIYLIPQINDQFAAKSWVYNRAEAMEVFAEKADSYVKSEVNDIVSELEDDLTNLITNNYYTRTDSDGRYAFKADAYIKAESDEKYSTKVYSEATYSKKVDVYTKDQLYTKYETDDKFVPLTQKVFNVDNVDFDYTDEELLSSTEKGVNWNLVDQSESIILKPTTIGDSQSMGFFTSDGTMFFGVSIDGKVIAEDAELSDTYATKAEIYTRKNIDDKLQAVNEKMERSEFLDEKFEDRYTKDEVYNKNESDNRFVKLSDENIVVNKRISGSLNTLVIKTSDSDTTKVGSIEWKKDSDLVGTLHVNKDGSFHFTDAEGEVFTVEDDYLYHRAYGKLHEYFAQIGDSYLKDETYHKNEVYNKSEVYNKEESNERFVEHSDIGGDVGLLSPLTSREGQIVIKKGTSLLQPGWYTVAVGNTKSTARFQLSFGYNVSYSVLDVTVSNNYNKPVSVTINSLQQYDDRTIESVAIVTRDSNVSDAANVKDVWMLRVKIGLRTTLTTTKMVDNVGSQGADIIMPAVPKGGENSSNMPSYIATALDELISVETINVDQRGFYNNSAIYTREMFKVGTNTTYGKVEPNLITFSNYGQHDFKFDYKPHENRLILSSLYDILDIDNNRIITKAYGRLDEYFAKASESYKRSELYTKAQSDDRYYSKSTADSRYYTKGLLYTKSEADSRFYQKKDLYTKSEVYTKGESDSNFLSYNDIGLKTIGSNGKGKVALYMPAEVLELPYLGMVNVDNELTGKIQFTSAAGSNEFRLYNQGYAGPGSSELALSVGKTSVYTLAYGNLHDYFAKVSDSYKKGDLYTKLESDNRYYSKSEADERYYNKDDLYTNSESDARFAKIGDSYLKADVYTKEQTYSKSDVYSKLETYAKGEVYSRGDADETFYSKSQSDNRYYTKSDIYTKEESDSRFLASGQSTYTLGSDGGNRMVVSNYSNDHASVGYMAWKNSANRFTAYIASTNSNGENDLEIHSQNSTGPNTSGLPTSLKVSTNRIWHSTYGNLHDYFAKVSNTFTKSQADSRYAKVGDAFLKSETYSRDSLYTKSQTYSKAEVYNRVESDNRYYQKSQVYNTTQSDNRYYTKSQSDANYYSKDTIDSVYSRKSDVYTKSESDNRYFNVGQDIYHFGPNPGSKIRIRTYDESMSLHGSVTWVDTNNKFAGYVDVSRSADKNELYVSLQGGGGSSTGDLPRVLTVNYDNIYHRAYGRLDEYFAKTADTYSKSEIYTKSQTDGKYALKSNTYSKSELYTKYESDNRYYTKSVADSRYYVKSEVYTKSDVYTKSESDSKYYTKDNTYSRSSLYTRSESDNRYYQKSQTYSKGEMNDIVENIQVGGRNYIPRSGQFFDNSHELSVDISELKGQLVTMSCHINLKNGSHGSQNRIGIEVTNLVRANGSSMRVGAWHNIENGANFSGRVSSTYIIPEDTPTDIMHMSVYSRLVLGDVREVGYVKLEKGNKATDWTPAPEDVQAEIDSVKSYTDSNFYKKSSVYSKSESNSRYYTKSESNNIYAPKSDTYRKADVYTKSQSDSRYYTKSTSDSRYYQKSDVYTKSESNDRYYTKSQTWPRGSLYTRSESDSRYYQKSQTYSKGEADDRYYTKSEVRDTVNSVEIGGRNLIVRSDLVDNTYLSSDNTAISHEDWCLTKYIEVDKNTDYIVSGYLNLGIKPSTVFYDSSKKYISGVVGSRRRTVTTPSNCEYMRVSINKRDLSTIKLERGNKATDWTPAPEDVQADIAEVKAYTDSNFYKKSDVYTKSESNSRYYTKSESNNLYARKTDTYTKSQVYTKSDVYTKSESDGKYLDITKDINVKMGASNGNRIYINTYTPDSEYVGVIGWKTSNDQHAAYIRPTRSDAENALKITLQGPGGPNKMLDALTLSQATVWTRAYGNLHDYFAKASDVYTKAQTWPRGSLYSRSESDARYYQKGDVYTKSQSNDRFFVQKETDTLFFGYNGTSNSDHIWHDDGADAFYFNSDTSVKNKSDASAYISKSTIWHRAYGHLHSYFAKVSDVYKKGDVYSKSEADSRYYTKSEADGRYYTKGTSDGRYYKKSDIALGDYVREVGRANATAGAGWISVAECTSNRYHGEVFVTDAESGDHSFIRIHWMRSFSDSNFNVINVGGYANRITGVRVLRDGDSTYGKKILQVYVTVSSNYHVTIFGLGSIYGYGDLTVVTPKVQNSISGYVLQGSQLTDLQNVTTATDQGIKTGGEFYAQNSKRVFHEGHKPHWNEVDGKPLSSSYTSTSTSNIATSKAVKIAYDRANNTYTKSESDGRYYTKSQTWPRGSLYSRSESDSRYYQKKDVYTKSEADGRYYQKSQTYSKSEADSRFFNQGSESFLSFSGTSGSNVDHIWHDDGSNTFYFNSDTSVKNAAATGNIKASNGTFTGYVYSKGSRIYNSSETDGRYYTKSTSDSRYYQKSSVYTKSETDGRYYQKSSVYTKSQSDGRYYQKKDVYSKSEADSRYLKTGSNGSISGTSIKAGASSPAIAFKIVTGSQGTVMSRQVNVGIPAEKIVDISGYSDFSSTKRLPINNRIGDKERIYCHPTANTNNVVLGGAGVYNKNYTLFITYIV